MGPCSAKFYQSNGCNVTTLCHSPVATNFGWEIFTLVHPTSSFKIQAIKKDAPTETVSGSLGDFARRKAKVARRPKTARENEPGF